MGLRGEEAYKACEGARIKGIDAGGDSVALKFDDGRILSLGLDGDCCSSSYFTDSEQFKELEGATIYKIEERDGQSDNNLPEPEGDCISWHFLVFVTDKGHVTIDWHNDSNGYYDGWVNASLS